MGVYSDRMHHNLRVGSFDCTGLETPAKHCKARIKYSASQTSYCSMTSTLPAAQGKPKASSRTPVIQPTHIILTLPLEVRIMNSTHTHTHKYMHMLKNCKHSADYIYIVLKFVVQFLKYHLIMLFYNSVIKLKFMTLKQWWQLNSTPCFFVFPVNKLVCPLHKAINNIIPFILSSFLKTKL